MQNKIQLNDALLLTLNKLINRKTRATLSNMMPANSHIQADVCWMRTQTSESTRDWMCLNSVCQGFRRCSMGDEWMTPFLSLEAMIENRCRGELHHALDFKPFAYHLWCDVHIFVFFLVQKSLITLNYLMGTSVTLHSNDYCYTLRNLYIFIFFLHFVVKSVRLTWI